MITIEELTKRKTNLTDRLSFAQAINAQATQADLQQELLIIELAMIGFKYMTSSEAN